MKLEAGLTVLGALLHAYYVCRNVETGEIAAKNLFELEPVYSHNFKLLMQIYGDASQVQDLKRVRAMMVRGSGFPKELVAGGLEAPSVWTNGQLEHSLAIGGRVRKTKHVAEK
ncbi:hypothetical protein R6Q59_014247 [Mikania micrantha]